MINYANGLFTYFRRDAKVLNVYITSNAQREEHCKIEQFQTQSANYIHEYQSLKRQRNLKTPIVNRHIKYFEACFRLYCGL